MVKFLDFLFLKIVHILIHLKKDVDGAKWSAFLYTGLYLTATVLGTLCFLGLQYDNYISNLIKHSSLVFIMISGIVIPLLLSLRYYRYTSVDKIEASFNAMGKNRRRIINILIYTAMIIIPVLTFVLFRLFVIGHVI